MVVNKIKKAFQIFFEGLFPPTCLVCQQEGPWLCSEHLIFAPAPESQASFEYLDSIHAGVAYHQEPAKTLVNQLKLTGNKDVAPLIVDEIIRDVSFDLENAYFQPVPLHWSREFYRGFNQAAVLAQEISSRFSSAKVSNFVIRKKRTKHQSLLDRNDRLKNLENAFEIRGGNLPETVILIDDVVATGQTLDQIAKILKEAGVKEVHGLVFARGGK